MAITNYLVHFKTEATYESNKDQLRNDAVAFVKDATIIHTHGTDYHCGSGPVALESDLANYATTSALTSGLAGKANTSHTHSISQISGLQTELDSKLESVSLADLGITATAAELNYVDGVTSNIQTQLNNKAASSHNHSAANITSGTLDLARIPSITDAKITSVSASKITGTIPQENLPSYVDDVLEYSSRSAFPRTGETGKIYVDTTTNLTYRWGGSSYVEISPSLALGETSSTAFRGDRGKIAYDHSQATGNPHNLTLSNLGISATAAELNFVDGVTSNIQTQLDGKLSSGLGISTFGVNGTNLVGWTYNGATRSTVTQAQMRTMLGLGSNAYTSTAYLPLAGGTMTGLLNLKYSRAGLTMLDITNTAGGEVFLRTYSGSTYAGAFTTNHTSYGTAIFNAIAGQYLGITNSGVPHFQGNTLLHSNNYTSYTVTKTGGGASGTWNINISGTAASANSVAWNNVSGKPSSFTPAAHNHSAANITSGTLAIARIPTGTTSSTVALGNHTHSQYLTSSSLSGYATQSWVNSQGFIKSATDTKNTAGSTNTSSKLFLIGATSQATSPVTYSNSSVYTINSELHASRMYATNGFYETSDARLKNFDEDIKALEVVSEIPTKYFIWKSDKSKTEHIGTSAQEIQKLYPDLVTENEDGVLSVDYARLSIIALAAIKELKAQIDELKSKIN